jgi:hypothetical protein
MISEFNRLRTGSVSDVRLAKMRLTEAIQVEYEADDPRPAPIGRVEREIKLKLGLEKKSIKKSYSLCRMIARDKRHGIGETYLGFPSCLMLM